MKIFYISLKEERPIHDWVYNFPQIEFFTLKEWLCLKQEQEKEFFVLILSLEVYKEFLSLPLEKNPYFFLDTPSDLGMEGKIEKELQDRKKFFLGALSLYTLYSSQKIVQIISSVEGLSEKISHLAKRQLTLEEEMRALHRRSVPLRHEKNRFVHFWAKFLTGNGTHLEFFDFFTVSQKMFLFLSYAEDFYNSDKTLEFYLLFQRSMLEKTSSIFEAFEKGKNLIEGPSSGVMVMEIDLKSLNVSLKKQGDFSLLKKQKEVILESEEQFTLSPGDLLLVLTPGTSKNYELFFNKNLKENLFKFWEEASMSLPELLHEFQFFCLEEKSPEFDFLALGLFVEKNALYGL